MSWLLITYHIKTSILYIIVKLQAKFSIINKVLTEPEDKDKQSDFQRQTYKFSPDF